MFLATDGFHGQKIEYPSKQSNLRHPFKLSTTPNNYAEHELTVEIVALFKVPFFNAIICKSVKKMRKNDIYCLKHV